MAPDLARLYIVRKRSEANGDITIESEIGKGTRVHLQIPALN